MAAKLTTSTSDKLFILNSGVTTLDIKVDLYSDVKEDWKDNAELNKFRFPIIAVGGQSIGGGQVISPYYMLRYGWKIRPQEANHTLTITGNIITDDETDVFVNTIGNFNVKIKSVVSSNSLTLEVPATGLTMGKFLALKECGRNLRKTERPVSYPLL